MELDLVTGSVAVVGALVALAVLGLLWLGVVLAWGQERTRGLAYYGTSPAERERFRGRMRFHRRMLTPVLSVLSRVSRFTFQRGSFRHGGVAAPEGTCSAESFAAAVEHEADSDEVYVVTQMRSGTTWMQHLVYQILTRGSGDLVGEGRTLYAVSPWLESVVGVPVDDAPRIGSERPSRIVKTHLPVELCPFASSARYIYVARHPVSCFASCFDFVTESLGPLAPTLEETEAWFCSRERMWWGSWPRHVDGWWRRAEDASNVLFVSFEAMVEDLPDVARRIAAFLGVAPLQPEEMRSIVEKTGFEYMKRHKGAFEMYPPNLLAVDGSYFTAGTARRHQDVPPEVQNRVMAWCRDELDETGFPMERFYPESSVASAPPSSPQLATPGSPLPPSR